MMFGAFEMTDYSRWSVAASEYSKCRLTKDSDKSVAFSGLAQEFIARTGDYYRACLLSGDMHRSFVWKAEPPASMCKPSAYHAPSWNWAALDGGVEFESRLGGEKETISYAMPIEPGGQGPVFLGKTESPDIGSLSHEIFPQAVIHEF